MFEMETQKKSQPDYHKMKTMVAEILISNSRQNSKPAMGELTQELRSRIAEVTNGDTCSF